MYVHLVTAANRALYLSDIEAMHRHRHEVFAEHMGWTSLRSADGLDIDEFDTPHTLYFLTLDADGNLRGSDRVNPSWRPHMLNCLFPEFAQAPIPTGPGVWEWSRHAPGHPLWSDRINAEARILSSIALLEFAASRGVDGFSGILETRVLPTARKLGWRPQELGAPVDYGEGVGVACYCPANLALLAKLRRIAGRKGPVLLELPGTLAARRPVELAMRLPEALAAPAEAAMTALFAKSASFEL